MARFERNYRVAAAEVEPCVKGAVPDDPRCRQAQKKRPEGRRFC
jgi:hypothetical protein